MPLVFAVLVILVLIFNAKDFNKNNARQSAIREKDRRKTNARLEQRMLDMYMKHGYPFDEAFRKSYEDVIAAGYDPCIPRNAYSKNRGGTQSSFCGYLYFEPEKFDSFWVKQRREDAEKQWLQSHPGENLCNADPNEIEAMIYGRFPTTEAEYLHDIKRSTKLAEAEPVGAFIIYPGLGTCEILAHNWVADGYGGGTYTLKVLKTGQIVTHIKIGDNRITKQGQ